MSDMNTAIVALGMIFLMFVSMIILDRHKRKRQIENLEGVYLFGEKITTQDYFSFCNTCIAYLLIAQEKYIDMKLFIQEKKLETNSGRESMRMIERTINLFPIVSCILDGTKLLLDEEKTIKKIEEYQKNTQKDDYIIPLFDIGVVSRNPKIFNLSTRYQHMKIVENILTSRYISDQFEEIGGIVKGLQELSCDKYKTPDIYYSHRNIDSKFIKFNRNED